ncbi:MAG TPA: hypothetical protein VE642_10385, partial [Pyrinomonadaceae bacterium]|nr:hypothetical protein [Pyrinomonadaceae bacterium]
MKSRKLVRKTATVAALVFNFCLLPFYFCLAQARAQIAVRGETVHTMAGAPVRDGVVLVRGGKIERVGPASSVKIPEGYRVVTARVVTPG